MYDYDVIVLGGGPAGLAAATSAAQSKAKTLLIERENKLGGILKQCIHDGFGLINFGERLTGPEYAEKYIKDFLKQDVSYLLSTFVTNAVKKDDVITLTIQNADGIKAITSKTLIIACGCRERTSRQVFIQGDRPAGIFSAGTAQYYVNVMGAMPTKKCVILGSGDIGLIMARRLTLEGAEVVGVYEIKPEPSGLTRNVVQCLDDFNIPLHLSTTVTKVNGKKRVESVEVAQVDEKFNVIAGTEKEIECDALILSVGLIPENEISEQLGIKIDPATKGPIVNQDLMTSVSGVFCCGNALHVNDLADYVSKSGIDAGENAANFINNSELAKDVSYSKDEFLYVVPQKISKEGKASFYFRSKKVVKNVKVTVVCGNKEIFNKKYKNLIPSEMEHIELNLTGEDAKFHLEVLE